MEVNKEHKLWPSLKLKFNLHEWTIESFATFMRSSYKDFSENSRPLLRLIRSNPVVASAFNKAFDFFSLNTPPRDPDDDCPLMRYLIEGVRRREFSQSILGMHLRIYWPGSIVQDNTEPTSASLLSDFRRQLYALVLPRDANCPFHLSQSPGSPHVVEYLCSPQGRTQLDEVKVYPDPQALEAYPTADNIGREDTERNSEIFQEIMTHLEPRSDSRIDYINDFGFKKGSMCLCIRYLVRQNEPLPRMRLTRQEIVSTICSVFWALDRNRSEEELSFYYRLQNVPSVRTCTLWIWLQCIYFNMRLFLAPLLFLDGQIPDPKDVFYSSVFFAFFQVGVMPEENYHASLSPSQIERIVGDRRNMIEQCGGLIEFITEDLIMGN